MAGLVLFLLVVFVSFMAPVYAHHIAHTDPLQPNVNGSTVVNGKTVEVIQQGGGPLGLGEIPIGPTWQTNYFIGADQNGRDVAARVLYGGRSSLLIGIGSALIACFIATVIGLIAGFFRGLTDSALSRLMDLIWAFPVYLLAITLSTVLLTTNGLQWGPIHVKASSLWIPTIIIGVIYVPYVMRPVRGQVLSVREKEFVDAAVAQ